MLILCVKYASSESEIQERNPLRNFTRATAFLLIFSACQTTLPPSLVPVSQSIDYGPQKAEGALIWLHGWCPGWKDCSKSPTPQFIDPEFNITGWDIYRLNVPPSYINHDNVGYYSRAEYHARLSLKHSQELRSQGYKRIVLAGYSGGGLLASFFLAP